jgi:hypothetical protein
MAYLINRNPAGRLICLHALISYLANRFHNSQFRLNDLKYDTNASHNIHQTCKLLISSPAINFTVCPYLDNPLSKAKCYLTQSIQEDKQKSKSASDAFNALEGLGLINRQNNLGYLTANGLEFARTDYLAREAFPLIRQAVLRYGPFWALLFLCKESKNDQDIVRREDIAIGYPQTHETILRDGKSIILSTGSQADTVTRTRSVLFTWAVSAGFFLPIGHTKPRDQSIWHIKLLPFIRSNKWNTHYYKVFLDDNMLSCKPYVDRPLEYSAMTKSTKALRERHQETQRNVTLELEDIIKNRRFAICYLLASASEHNSGVDFDKMVKGLASHRSFFVIEGRKLAQVIQSELKIAFITGIPFYERNRVLYPLTRLNMRELTWGAPQNLIEALQKISTKVMSR